MKSLLAFFTLIPFLLCCQPAVLNEININSEKFGDTHLSIHYPVVVLQNKVAEKNINTALKKALIDDNVDDTALSTEAALKQYSKELLIEMTYTALFNKNGILSLDVYCAVNGLYDFDFHKRLNFNLADGSMLTLAQAIKPGYIQAFKQELLHNKRDSIQVYLKDLKQGVDVNDISREVYNQTVQDIKGADCKDSLDINDFSITQSHIQVYTNCGISNRDIRKRYPAGFILQYTVKRPDKWIAENFVRKIAW